MIRTPIRPLRAGERRTYRAVDGQLVQVERTDTAWHILNMRGEVIQRYSLKQGATLMAFVPTGDAAAKP